MTMPIPIAGAPAGRRPHASPPMRDRGAGFTLLELMITVVIVAILASIALPSYRSYVLRSNRAAVRAMLVDIAAKQEVEALKSGAYASDFNFYLRGSNAAMNVGLTRFFITSSGLTQAVATGQSVYQIDLSTTAVAATSRSFTLTATAIGSQTQDSDCLTLSVNSAGQRLPGAGSACWSR